MCRFCAGETAASFTASGQVKPRGLLWNLSAARRLHPTAPPLYDASPGRAWRNLPRVNFCLPRGFILIIQISGVKLILWLGSRERWVGGRGVSSVEYHRGWLCLISGGGTCPAACGDPVEIARYICFCSLMKTASLPSIHKPPLFHLECC